MINLHNEHQLDIATIEKKYSNLTQVEMIPQFICVVQVIWINAEIKSTEV
jgi:hypothetical protein